MKSNRLGSGIITATALMAAAMVAGCSASSSQPQPVAATPATTTASAAPTASQQTRARPTPARLAPSHGRRHNPAVAALVPAGVPMPNPRLTPGAIQSSNTAAICTPGWAEAHRDVSSATKDYVASEYGLSSHSGYEIDHLIPLELGGANSVANLWPEPYGSPFGATQKDGLEDYLHDQVCYHGMPLAEAQHEIASNWYAAWIAAGKPVPSDFGYTNGPGPGATATPSHSQAAPARSTGGSSGAWCTAAASYSSEYGDYDVYVHSNQPDQDVTATSGSYSKNWHTDSSGNADVYLRGPGQGDPITVRVGNATCSTTA